MRSSGACVRLITILVLAAVGLAAPHAAQAKTRVLAAKTLHAPAGGTVRAADGAALLVPKGVLKHTSRVSITRTAKGYYDFHINGTWSGQVRVTLPARKGGSGKVMHRIGNMWVLEGSGQRSVWVTHLSLFSWLGDKLKALCITKDPKQFLTCVRDKGLSKIDSALVKWIAGAAGVSNECAQSLLASKGFVSTLLTAIASDACTGHAGESGYHVPADPAPAPSDPAPADPAPSDPAPGDPAPAPSPAPAPAGGQSVQIDWSSANPGYVILTLDGFPVGAHDYTCHFASGGDATYTLQETSSPQTWDNGHTCFDRISGDTVQVIVEGVESNVLTVP